MPFLIFLGLLIALIFRLLPPLIFAILILIGIGRFLAYIYQKVQKPYFFAIIFAPIVSLYIAFKFYEMRYRLSVVPQALQVKSISYHQESWAIGPGDSEAGIILYPLSKNVAHIASRRGLNFFLDLPPDPTHPDGKLYQAYRHWQETPIIPNKDWTSSSQEQNLNLYDYICQHTCIDVNPTVAEETAEIINSSGSYYAYGHSGLIVVSPQEKIVVYLYRLP